MLKKLRLLHVLETVDSRAGGPIAGVVAACRARAESVEAEVLSFDAADAPWLKDFPLPVHAVGLSGAPLAALGRYSFSPRGLDWLKSYAADYDGVLVHGIWTFPAVAVHSVLKRMNLPYYVYAHGMLDPWFRSSSQLKHWKKQVYWTLALGPALRDAAGVLFTAEEERLRARGAFLGHGYKERVISYGVDDVPPPTPAQTAAFAAHTPDLAGRPFLLFLGRVHVKKGVDLLVDAFHQMPDKALHLVIAGPEGNDALGDRLRRRISELGLGDRVHWTGMLTGDAKWGAFRSAAAFVLPSHQENFGIAVAEAMACATPVLISDKVNIWREVVQDGGGLAESDTLEGATRLLTRFTDLDAAERAQMGRAARESFLKRFDIQTNATEILDIVQAEIAARAHAAALQPSRGRPPAKP